MDLTNSVSTFLDLPDEIHRDIALYLTVPYEPYDPELFSLFNLVRCSRKTYKIYIKFLYRRLSFEFSDMDGVLKGIDWKAVDHIDIAHIPDVGNYSNGSNLVIQDYIALIRENIIIDPTSKFETHVRKFDALKCSRIIGVYDLKSFEDFKSIVLHGDPTSGTPKSFITDQARFELSSVSFGRGIMRGMLNCTLIPQDRSSLIFPARLCLYAPYRINGPPGTIAIAMEGTTWDDLRKAVDILIPGWRDSVKEVTWHGIQYLEDIKSIPKIHRISHIYFSHNSHYEYDVHQRLGGAPLTSTEYVNGLSIVFEQLRRAIIKPSADKEPFELYKIRIRYNHVIRFFRLPEFLEYAKGRIGPNERLAEEEDFIRAGWFDIEEPNYCDQCHCI
ncbi:hypothetical protein I204_03069 [Kwoniella mangroviensis CBS 8886]|nr:hypothetical protein I204_03069 [Kwoniella mangroviensis CBS 8886]